MIYAIRVIDVWLVLLLQALEGEWSGSVLAFAQLNTPALKCLNASMAPMYSQVRAPALLALAII